MTTSPASALMEMRSLDVKIYPSNEALAAALKCEEVWLTLMWLARGFMWKKAGIPVEHAVPAEGATSICFEMAVPKNARNRDGGMAYLNAMLDPRAQTAFADRMGYAPTVNDAGAAAGPRPADQPDAGAAGQAPHAGLRLYRQEPGAR